ncbi:MAG: FkbM family methyltransferase, partial [Nitrospirota bacterium]
DVLSSDPFVSLQMGHFVRTGAALATLFDESLDTGEDFDYYLRIWDTYRCIKVPLPFFYNRRGLHSLGPRSATGYHWRQRVEQIMQEKRSML